MDSLILKIFIEYTNKIKPQKEDLVSDLIKIGLSTEDANSLANEFFEKVGFNLDEFNEGIQKSVEPQLVEAIKNEYKSITGNEIAVEKARRISKIFVEHEKGLYDSTKNKEPIKLEELFKKTFGEFVRRPIGINEDNINSAIKLGKKFCYRFPAEVTYFAVITFIDKIFRLQSYSLHKNYSEESMSQLITDSITCAFKDDWLESANFVKLDADEFAIRYKYYVECMNKVKAAEDGQANYILSFVMCSLGFGENRISQDNPEDCAFIYEIGKRVLYAINTTLEDFTNKYVII